MLQVYLLKYRSMELDVLLKEWNAMELSEENITEMFVISTSLIGRYCRIQKPLLECMDGLASAAVSLIISRIVDREKRWTLPDISRVVDEEVKEIGGLIYSSHDFLRIENPFESEDESIDNSAEIMNSLIYDEIVTELISYTPKHLRLLMFTFITTGELLIQNYSKEDKLTVWLILNKLEVNIVASDISFEYFEKLRTATQKALFLQILRTESPEVFSLFAILNDINTILHLSSFSTCLNISIHEIANTVEICAKKAIDITENQVDIKDQSDLQFFIELSQNMLFSPIKEIRIDKIVRDSILPIYTEWEDTVKENLKRYRGSTSLASQQLTQELRDSISVINTLNTIVDLTPTSDKDPK